MAVGTCDHCQKESNFLDMFAGMRLKCKVCQTGFVTLPPKAGAVYAKPEPAVVVPPLPAPVPKPKIPPRQLPHTVEPTQESELPEAVKVLLGESTSADRWQYFLYFDLIVFGIGSVVLDQFGLIFACLRPIESLQPYAGMIMAVVGIYFLVSKMKASNALKQTTNE